MKKILTLALVAALLTATGITAFAADTEVNQDTTPPTGAMTVNYTVDPAYTVVIPESVTLGDTAVTEQIKIYGATENDNVVIGKGQKVNVALTASANNFNVANTDGDTVDYTVNGENTTAALASVAECTADDGTKNTDITFTKTGTAAYAGTYTDTLTFTVSLEDAAVAVTGVTLNKISTEIIVGNNETLTATVAPDDATDKTVTWTTSDESIATVDENGKVTAVAEGTATITAIAGDKTATCTVNAAIPLYIQIAYSDYDTKLNFTKCNDTYTYKSGEMFVDGGATLTKSGNNLILHVKPVTWGDADYDLIVNTVNNTYTVSRDSLYDTPITLTIWRLNGTDIAGSLTKV